MERERGTLVHGIQQAEDTPKQTFRKHNFLTDLFISAAHLLTSLKSAYTGPSWLFPFSVSPQSPPVLPPHTLYCTSTHTHTSRCSSRCHCLPLPVFLAPAPQQATFSHILTSTTLRLNHSEVTDPQLELLLTAGVVDCGALFYLHSQF